MHTPAARLYAYKCTQVTPTFDDGYSKDHMYFTASKKTNGLQSHLVTHYLKSTKKTHSTIHNLHNKIIQLQPQVQDTPYTLTQVCHMTYTCVLCTGNSCRETILAWWHPLSCMLIHTCLMTDTRPCRLQRILILPLPLLLLWNLLLPWKMHLFHSFCLKNWEMRPFTIFSECFKSQTCAIFWKCLYFCGFQTEKF